jgi:hypothetical protein
LPPTSYGCGINNHFSRVPWNWKIQTSIRSTSRNLREVVIYFCDSKYNCYWIKIKRKKSFSGRSHLMV